MNKPTSDADQTPPRPVDERVVYVMPDNSQLGQDDDSIDLSRLWNTLWRGKWTILAVTFLFGAGSVAYALTLTHWYRSDVLMAPAGEESVDSGLASQLGSLAGIAGIKVNAGGNSREALAVLRSRDFNKQFVRDLNLLPVLFADKWDAGAGEWIGDPDSWPNDSDGARYFSGELRSIAEDRETGLVTVTVEWTDPELAAVWVTEQIRRLNNHMRERALEKAEANLAYLETQLLANNVLSLNQALGRLLEREQQKIMLARGNTEFAFRIIDSAEVAETPFRPRRKLMVIVATVFGGFVGVLLVMVGGFVRDSESQTSL